MKDEESGYLAIDGTTIPTEALEQPGADDIVTDRLLHDVVQKNMYRNLRLQSYTPQAAFGKVLTATLRYGEDVGWKPDPNAPPWDGKYRPQHIPAKMIQKGML